MCVCVCVCARARALVSRIYNSVLKLHVAHSVCVQQNQSASFNVLLRGSRERPLQSFTTGSTEQDVLHIGSSVQFGENEHGICYIVYHTATTSLTSNTVPTSPPPPTPRLTHPPRTHKHTHTHTHTHTHLARINTHSHLACINTPVSYTHLTLPTRSTV